MIMWTLKVVLGNGIKQRYRVSFENRLESAGGLAFHVVHRVEAAHIQRVHSVHRGHCTLIRIRMNNRLRTSRGARK